MKTKQEMPNQMDQRYHHIDANLDMLEKGAILQKDGTYAIAPHLAGGLIMDPDLLIRISNVMKKYNIPAVKATSSQRLALVGIKKDDVDAVWHDLKMKPGAAIGLCVRVVKFCPGSTFCRRGQQDAIGLGMEIDKKYHGMNLPNKFKIGISGCPNKCMDSTIIDFGAMGTAKGFTVYVGGNGGARPRFADKLAENQPPEKVIEILDRVVDYYKKEAQTYERVGNMIDRIGFDKFQTEVVPLLH
ncbi:nitrite and sulphite reductase 4Fe-4S region [Desulfofarcimen acetoxidans DSM 771]|uniref:Nitrite and sulphite reductase 4Fe-4S region n=1 Tax=Desulfofarcimen acetoxidans (strain ATCC 49208 / DSM 771 / KCTC 5769 / VKM B-1644 / 5575) TaxID=485916 RepID=C8VWD9_DESAS|nr:NAD(P)/FAD-dependent oxidoreductase [Desulfofarcimen acetoxidans]ACV62491.1 nitrite and sulphite reductase 4Fe-4S region [Desulfofarcimen acetoxidans DSM 771]